MHNYRFKIMFLTLIISAFVGNVNSEVMFLQNGTNGYEGCIDGSYQENHPDHQYNNVTGSTLYIYNYC